MADSLSQRNLDVFMEPLQRIASQFLEDRFEVCFLHVDTFLKFELIVVVIMSTDWQNTKGIYF